MWPIAKRLLIRSRSSSVRSSLVCVRPCVLRLVPTWAGTLQRKLLRMGGRIGIASEVWTTLLAICGVSGGITPNAMVVRFLDENNDMEQIGDDREIDLQDTGFSNAFSNLLDAMVSDPDWAPVVDRFITQLTSPFTDGYATVSVGYAWHSSDGETWNRITSKGPLDRGEFAAIMATPDGFIATATSTRLGSFDSRRVWESDNGTNWTVATGLTSSHALDTSLAELQGKPVELLYRSQRGVDPQVLTLTVPQQELASEIPGGGMVVEIGGLGLIGTPISQPAESDKMEILL
jgi:hypothetical protein